MHLFNYFLLKYHYSSKNQCVRDWDFVFLYMWIVQHPDNFDFILKETSLLSLSIRPFMLTLRAKEQCTILLVSADTATLHLGFTILSKWLTVEIQTWKQSSDFSNSHFTFTKTNLDLSYILTRYMPQRQKIQVLIIILSFFVAKF